MLSHEAVWAAIDALAKKNGLSSSGLAKKSGLDATSFNKSKRVTPAGRPRWPSTESIAKALKATDTDLDGFLALVKRAGRGGGDRGSYRARPAKCYPVIGFAKAGVGGFFDDGGFPVGHGWDEITFPDSDSETAYALKVSGDSMLPVYRHGDTILVAPTVAVRKGDRVVVKTRDGEVMAKVLARRTNALIELLSFNPEHADRTLASEEVEWIARIVWASQ